MNLIRQAVILTLCLFVFGDAWGALDSIYKLRRLKPERAAEGKPLLIEAQVVRTNPLKNNFFLFDGKEGVFVQFAEGSGVVQDLRQGDVVRVAGRTVAGGFAPSIAGTDVEVVDHRPVPEGRQIHNNDYYATGIDCQWLMILGRIVSVSISPNRQFIEVEVSRNARILNAQVPYSAENLEKISAHLFNFVAFNAVAGTVFNLNRQFVSRVFYVHSADDFVTAGKEFKMNVEVEAAIHELMGFRQVINRPIRTSGTVIHATENQLYLRGEQASLRASVPPSGIAKLGDVVHLEGIVQPLPVSPGFLARSVEVTDHVAIPEPVRIDPAQSIDPRLNFNLICLEAELIDYGTEYFSEDGTTVQLLRCRAAGQQFDVVLPQAQPLDDGVEPGAILELTGICHVLVRPDRVWYLDVAGFRLELRGPEDVKILVPAPWWTAQRLLWFAATAGMLSLLFLGWIIALRKTVDRQTRVISQKVEREAVMEERQRFARELHDNLEQGLAGATIQLNTCQRLTELNRDQHITTLEESMECVDEVPLELQQRFRAQKDEIEDAARRSHRALQVAETMITRCSQESRATILELRGGILEKMDLVSAVEVSASPLADECGAALEFSVSGKPLRLKQAMERNILLIMKEAISNAARHSSPSRIAVGMGYEANALTVSVEDDGDGFDMSAPAKPGHFGLKGMGERAAQFGGGLKVVSAVGEGTRVVAVFDQLDEWKVG